MFNKRPVRISPEDLVDTFEARSGKQGRTFGEILNSVFSDEMTVAHIPFAYEGFLQMEPVFICSGTLTDEDMYGYYMYLDDDGF